MKIHHKELGLEATTVSDKSARALLANGWAKGPLPESAKKKEKS